MDAQVVSAWVIGFMIPAPRFDREGVKPCTFCFALEEAHAFAGDLFRRSMGQLMPIGNFTTHIEWDTADAIVRVGIRYDDSDTPPGAKAPRLLLPLLCTRYAEKWSVAPTRCAS